METPRYSVSYATVTPVRRSPSTVEMAGAVWCWLIGRPRPASQTDRLIERRLVDEIAEEIEAEGGSSQHWDNPPPRPRRMTA